jgi:Kdo2-lipid IVA lauroyltransferase/acyltransferase
MFFLAKIIIELVFIFFALLPASVARILGVVLGWFLRVVIGFRQKRINKQLGWAFPELNDYERAKLDKSVYRHFGLLVIEILRLPRWSNQKLKDQICIYHDMGNLENALARGKGALILAAHMGNWEIGLAGAAAAGIKTNAVTKEIKGGLGQYVADRMRFSHGVKTIPRRNSIRDILKTLRKNECLGFVLDQNMTTDEGVFVDFFDRTACTMPGLAVLAQRADAPVVPAQFWRDEDDIHHHIRFLPEMKWESPSDDRDGNILHNTQRYTKILERLIREHPEQWLWMHRRWRTQPE